MATTQTPNRFEITRIDDEPNTWYCLDTKRNRAEFLRIEWRGGAAKVQNDAPGHGGPYWVEQVNGAWRCECKAAERGLRCYHLAAVEAAAPIGLPEARERSRQEGLRRFMAYRPGHYGAAAAR